MLRFDTRNSEGFPRDFRDATAPDPVLVSGDGPELYDGVGESMEELLPWMPRPAEHGTVEDLGASAREAWVRFVERIELRMHL